MRRIALAHIFYYFFYAQSSVGGNSIPNQIKPSAFIFALILEWFAVFMAILLLVLALINQDKKLREVDEYHIERCYNDNGIIRLKVAFIPILTFDYVITVATETDEREEVIGIGKVTNVKPGS